MSILIKGMKMPTNCCQCPVNMDVCKRGYEYLLAHSELYDKRADDCPIVFVPPNGRLIDADKIGLTDFEIILCQKGNPFKNALEMLFEKINNAPTIIPADGEKNAQIEEAD